MRIGLDGIPLSQPRTGVGHYTFELAQALAGIAPADDFELVSPFAYVTLADEKNGPPVPPNLRITRAPTKTRGRLWFALGLPRYARRKDFTLFHGTNYEVPLWDVCPTVLTIHDLSLLLYPETHEARRVRRARWRLPLMARRATLIITVTESVRREVCEHLHVNPEKVVAVHSAPRRLFKPAAEDEIRKVRGRLGVEEDFLLSVGTIEPRKNLLTLVRAFKEIVRAPHASRRPLQLVIVGAAGWLTDEFFAGVQASGIRDRLLFTGYIPDEDLRALYSSCAAFIYPSLYEGFGLPPLEAMACGAPVIASRIDSLIETIREETARLVSPTDIAALAGSIAEVLGDPNMRLALSTAGRKHAAQFTWERTARQTLDVYQEALRRRG